MEIPTDPLELAIYLWRCLEHREVDDRTVSGQLPELLDFGQVQDRLDTLRLLGVDDSSQRYLEFTLPSQTDGFFALSISGLLENPSRCQSAPSKFYLADIDALYDAEATGITVPTIIENYLLAVDLAGALQSVADHGHVSPSGSLNLVFLTGRKLEIEIIYGASDLCPLQGLPEFKERFIESGIHVQQKATILRSALLELFSHDLDDTSYIPFPRLLTRFCALCDKVQHGYDLYVSEFSFEKIKGQVEKEKVEFITRLNKVFSDIQNQLLAVPAALILAGGQMKAVGEWKESNLLIWLGCIVFAVFMTMLIRNQRITLEAVKQEIEHQWHQIESEHRTVADRFSGIYSLLDKRYRQQKWLLRAVDFLVAVVVALTTGLLLWYSTTPAVISSFLNTSVCVGVPLIIIHLTWEYYSDVAKLLGKIW